MSRNAAAMPPARAAWRWALGLGFALMTGGAAMAQGTNPPAAALGWLSLEPSPAGVVVVGHALALTRGTIDATMTIARTGKAGTSRTRQSDHVTLDPGATATLSRTGLSLVPGDHLAVDLELSQDGHVVSRSRIDSGG
jgi:hypothetical protein